MPRPDSPYGPEYQRARARLLARRPSCHICGGPGADSADHVPALGLHAHRPGTGCCVLKPAHLRCNVRAGAWRVVNARRRLRAAGTPVPLSRKPKWQPTTPTWRAPDWARG